MVSASSCDWRRNNKVALRNFSDSSDFHDVVKTILVRMIRREHNHSQKVPIYTEFSPDKPNEEYPDIWMRLKGDIYVWEIQKQITKSWTERICKQYESVNLIIVNLKEDENEWMNHKLFEIYPIKALREVLLKYVV